MFDEATAQRLDRLERETSRRKWDDVVLTASQRSLLEQDPAAGECSLMDLLADRFDRLERKQRRLEWQISRLERRPHLWRRAFLGALVVGILAVGLGSVAVRPWSGRVAFRPGSPEDRTTRPAPRAVEARP